MLEPRFFAGLPILGGILGTVGWAWFEQSHVGRKALVAVVAICALTMRLGFTWPESELTATLYWNSCHGLTNAWNLIVHNDQRRPKPKTPTVVVFHLPTMSLANCNATADRIAKTEPTKASKPSS